MLKAILLIYVFILMTVVLVSAENEKTSENEKEEDVKIDQEKMEWAKGSLCGYCEYCKFCKLCDEDCPCETSATKPNCNMCKYCKYCTLCKACDTFCQAGGIIDRATAYIFNSLPTTDYNKKEIDNDIDSVKHWIDKKKDEL